MAYAAVVPAGIEVIRYQSFSLVAQPRSDSKQLGDLLASAGLGKDAAARARICRRREFMASQLGIHLKPEVLPLSNLAGYLPPYWLAPNLAMRKV